MLPRLYISFHMVYCLRFFSRLYFIQLKDGSMQDMDDQPGSTAILMKPAEIFAVR